MAYGQNAPGCEVLKRHTNNITNVEFESSIHIFIKYILTVSNIILYNVVILHFLSLSILRLKYTIGTIILQCI